jgi:archaellum biogenesis ATPase FlaH
MLRTLKIDKLRGVEIRKPFHLFSLANSSFDALSTMNHIKLNGVEPFQPISVPGELISTGNRDLDRALGGGIKRGTMLLLEISPEVNRSALALILAGAVMNNLSQGNPAIVVGSPDRSYKSVLKYIVPFCRTEDIDDHLVLLSHEGEDVPPCVRQLPGTLEENNAVFLRVYEEVKVRSGKDSPLIITYDLGMTEISHPETIRQIESRIISGIRKIRSNGDVEILVNRAGFSSMTFSRTICDVHLQLTEINGVILLSVVRPNSGRYALILDDAINYPSYRLKEIN